VWNREPGAARRAAAAPSRRGNAADPDLRIGGKSLIYLPWKSER